MQIIHAGGQCKDSDKAHYCTDSHNRPPQPVQNYHIAGWHILIVPVPAITCRVMLSICHVTRSRDIPDTPLITGPLPKPDESCNKIVGVQPERSIKPLSEEHPHSCQGRCDTHHPHEILLANLIYNIDYACDKGEYLHPIH